MEHCRKGAVGGQTGFHRHLYRSATYNQSLTPRSQYCCWDSWGSETVTRATHVDTPFTVKFEVPVPCNKNEASDRTFQQLIKKRPVINKALHGMYKKKKFSLQETFFTPCFYIKKCIKSNTPRNRRHRPKGNQDGVETISFSVCSVPVPGHFWPKSRVHLITTSSPALFLCKP